MPHLYFILRVMVFFVRTLYAMVCNNVEGVCCGKTEDGTDAKGLRIELVYSYLGLYQSQLE